MKQKDLKDLVENEHVTSEGKVFFYLEGLNVTTKPKTILVHKYRNTRQFACIALDCAVTTAQEHSYAHACFLFVCPTLQVGVV